MDDMLKAYYKQQRIFDKENLKDKFDELVESGEFSKPDDAERDAFIEDIVDVYRSLLDGNEYISETRHFTAENVILEKWAEKCNKNAVEALNKILPIAESAVSKWSDYAENLRREELEALQKLEEFVECCKAVNK